MKLHIRSYELCKIIALQLAVHIDSLDFDHNHTSPTYELERRSGALHSVKLGRSKLQSKLKESSFWFRSFAPHTNMHTWVRANIVPAVHAAFLKDCVPLCFGQESISSTT